MYIRQQCENVRKRYARVKNKERKQDVRVDSCERIDSLESTRP